MGSAESYSVLESGDIQRWTAKRKSAVVLEIVKGTSTPAEIARKHGNITAGEVQGWIDEFLEAGEERMRARPRDLEAQFEAKKKDQDRRAIASNRRAKKMHRLLGKELPPGIE